MNILTTILLLKALLSASFGFSADGLPNLSSIPSSIPKKTELNCEGSFSKNRLTSGNLPYEYLQTGKKVSGARQNYHDEGDNKLHAKMMIHTGNDKVKSLMEEHGGAIPEGTAVLEIGPFFNPLGEFLSPKHQWVVWEYDSAASEKLASNELTKVFHVDLNRLKESTWKSFMDLNRHALKEGKDKPVKFGAVLLSSVINYIDYKSILTKLMEEIVDGGIVFIGNVDVGDIAKMRNKKAVLSSEIVEFLFEHFPDTIEILPHSYFFSESIGLERQGLKMAVRVHKNSEKVENVDMYKMGLGMSVDFSKMEYPIAHVLQFKNPPHSDQSQKLIQYWLDSNPKTVAEAMETARNPPWGIARMKNRQAEIALALIERREFILKVKSSPKNSWEWLSLKNSLTIEPFRQNFIPERDILIQALDLEEHQRGDFLSKNLGELYLMLRHPDSLSWLNIPPQ